MSGVPDRSGQFHDNEAVETARRLLKPSRVDVGEVPRWLTKQMLEEMRSAGLIDHAGTTLLADGRRAFVSEPYGASASAMADAEAIAKRHGLEFWLSPNSWHFPGWTVRLVFVQPPGVGTNTLRVVESAPAESGEP